MTALDKRVQVLFDPERYALLATEARAAGMSVGAFIRESVDQRLGARQNRAVETLHDLFARAAAAPVADSVSVEEWYREYDDELARTDLP